MENSIKVSQKIKNRTDDPAIPLLGIYSKEMKTGPLRYLHPLFIAGLFTIAKIWEQTKWPSTDEWIKKTWCAYMIEYYWTLRKKEILPFVTIWMNLEDNVLSQISQKETSLICEIKKVRLIEIESRVVVTIWDHLGICVSPLLYPHVYWIMCT